ncbi:MAG: hypothetical protein QOI76_2483 [Frankiales bacterium]|nr:hypothetical protein [Frankiales bacterium]
MAALQEVTSSAGDPADAGDSGLQTRSGSLWLAGTSALLCLQAVVLGVSLVAGSWFADDLYNAEIAQKSSLSWTFLSRAFYGHFLPAAQVPVWVGARLELHHTSVVLAELVLILLTTALFVRLLRSLVGDRPLLVFSVSTVFALSPIALPGYLWWSAAVELVPSQLCVVLAFLGYVRWRRGHGRWLLVAVATATGVGICFWDPANLIIIWLPTLEFALAGPTFLERIRAVARAWPMWLALLVPLVAYQAYYLQHDYASPSAVRAELYLHFLSVSWSEAFVPALLGGPLRWSLSGIGHYGGAGTPLWFEIVSQLVLAAVVLVTVRRRPSVWGAWLLVLVAIGTELTLVSLGRLTNGVSIAHDYRYHALAVAPVMVGVTLAVGAAWPKADHSPVRHRLLEGWRQRAGVLLVSGITAVALVSCWGYATTWSTLRTGSYLSAFAADAEQLRHDSPSGTIGIVDDNVPDWVLPHDMLGQNASQVSSLVRPTLPRGVTFDGVVETLYRVAPSGHVVPAELIDVRPLVVVGKDCTTGKRNQHLVAYTTAEPPASTGYVIRLHLRADAAFAVALRLREDRTTPLHSDTYDSRTFAGVAGARTVVAAEEGLSFDTVKLEINSTKPVCITGADFGRLGPA